MIEVASDVRLWTDQLMLELCRQLETQQLVVRSQVDELMARQALTGDSIHVMLIKEGLCTEHEVLKAISTLTGIPYRPISDFTITQSIAESVPPRVALRYNVVPVRATGGTLTLAVCEAPTPAMADSLRMILNIALDWVLCIRSDVDQTRKHFYGLGAAAVDKLVEEYRGQAVQIAGTDVSIESSDEGVVRFVNQIIGEAIQMDATDIHIEPFENVLRLRYRIDGILQEIPVPQGIAHLQKAIASSVKIMAEMDIAERRKPHDGRIKVRSGQTEFDLRVSILPTAHGETVNMRILNRNSSFIDLEHLGLSAEQMPKIEQLYSLPHGVTLLTGPTGSGKTTTLYALLSRISTTDVKIITVEDPIEYQMKGINQIQVNSKIGLTFATILRSILRHDPDIILIGEIRDSETADIAVRSSLTGHLVFSTLHTNDAPSAVTRLVDMGVEPYLVSSCLEGVIAQRLVRRICSQCKERFKPDSVIVQEIAAYFPDRIADAQFARGHGCPNCNFTGYRGRLAILEIMLLNEALRSLVVHQRPSNEIKRQAELDGMETLRKDGWKRVLAGDTTVEEVLRVARKAENAPSA